MGTLKPVGMLLVVGLVGLSSLGSLTQGMELTVCPQGPPVCDFAKIQEAIKAAPPGATLRISPGLYTENLMINKGLKLVGRLVRVQGAIASMPVIFIWGDIPIEIEIIGLSIAGKGNKCGLRVEAKAIALLEDIQIYGNENGLCTGSQSQVKLAGSQLFGNGKGMWLGGSARAQIQNTHIFSNLIVGLIVEGSASLEILNGSITGHLDDRYGLGGLLIRESAQAILINTHVTSNRLGIAVWDSSSARIQQSMIAFNDLHGILVAQSANSIILQSTITYNGISARCRVAQTICAGIEMRGSSQALIGDSHILDNVDWGVTATLKKCGYPADDFSGKVELMGSNIIVGNNWAGNHEGEVCLP